MAGSPETQPLLGSPDESSVPSSSLGPASGKTADSSGSTLSLRLFKTRSPPLSTIWKSPPTDSRGYFPSVSLRTRGSHGPSGEIGRGHFLMQIMRGSVGTGVLALPSAVANAGLVFGCVGIVLTSLTIIHSINLLVECAQFLRSRHSLHDVDLDYGHTVEYAFVFGTSAARRFRWASRVLNLCLAVTQYGIAVVYVLFVSENVKYMVDYYAPAFDQPLVVYIACTTAVMLPLIFIRSIRVLSVISGAGNVLMAAGITLILIYCVQDIPPLDRYPLITNIDRIPLFFGVAVFSFESINVVLPSENALRDKSNLLGLNGLLNVSFFLVLILYFAVAFYGYVRFGDGVKGSLTYSMPLTPWYSMIVKPIYAALIAMSFGLQFYILYQVVWQAFTRVAPARLHKCWIDCVLRVFMMFLIVAAAAAIPHVDLVISLTGALTGSAICLIFPALIHIVLFWDQSYRFRCFSLVMAKNILIIAFGIFGAIIGTYTSILGIYNAFQPNPN